MHCKPALGDAASALASSCPPLAFHSPAPKSHTFTLKLTATYLDIYLQGTQVWVTRLYVVAMMSKTTEQVKEAIKEYIM